MRLAVVMACFANTAAGQVYQPGGGQRTDARTQAERRIGGQDAAVRTPCPRPCGYPLSAPLPGHRSGNGRAGALGGGSGGGTERTAASRPAGSQLAGGAA